jgi:hypothetical protein
VAAGAAFANPQAEAAAPVAACAVSPLTGLVNAIASQGPITLATSSVRGAQDQYQSAGSNEVLVGGEGDDLRIGGPSRDVPSSGMDAAPSRSVGAMEPQAGGVADWS